MWNHAKDDRARKDLARWYRLGSFAMSLPVLFFLAMLFSPLLHGRSLHPSDLGYAAVACALTTLVALVAAWLVWRFLWRKEWIASAIFTLIVAATAIWTTVLSPPQRADARSIAGRTVETQVENLTQVALDVID